MVTDQHVFWPAPARLADERAKRLALAARAVSYHHSFLDDALRGILPHDLVLIGAETGAGKTDLALSIAKGNATAGKRSHYIALEAEPDEIERRIKYGLIVELATAARHPRLGELNYPDWCFGRCEHVAAEYDAAASALIIERFGKLRTYYRADSFGDEHIRRLFAAARFDKSELITLDHAHYIDLDADDNEHRAFKATVKLIRDTALEVGIPVVLVAHLRKRDQRARRLVPHVEDFHGSSDLTKICTQVIQLAPAHDVTPAKWWSAPTYFAIPKDRRGGALPFVGLCNFDTRFRSYAPGYTLGRLTDHGTKWDEVRRLDVPRWATNHRPLEGVTP